MRATWSSPALATGDLVVSHTLKITDTLPRIAAGHPINRIDQLMPWACQPYETQTAP